MHKTPNIPNFANTTIKNKQYSKNSTSPYAYVGNNPINHRDFMGLWSFPVYVNGVLDHYVYGDGGWDTANSTLGGGGGSDLPSCYGGNGGGDGGFGSSGGGGSSVNVINKTGKFWASWFGKTLMSLGGYKFVETNRAWNSRFVKKGLSPSIEIGDLEVIAYDEDPDGGEGDEDKQNKTDNILNTVNQYASITSLFSYAEYGIMNSKDYLNGVWHTFGNTNFKFQVRNPIQFSKSLEALKAAKWFRVGGNVLGGISGGIYAYKSYDASNNNNNLQGLSNGLMSFYSFVGARGGLAGKVFTAPFFIIDATVGMDNFILHTINYGNIQSKQIQNGNYGVGIWRPGMGLK